MPSLHGFRRGLLPLWGGTFIPTSASLLPATFPSRTSTADGCRQDRWFDGKSKAVRAFPWTHLNWSQPATVLSSSWLFFTLPILTIGAVRQPHPAFSSEVTSKNPSSSSFPQPYSTALCSKWQRFTFPNVFTLTKKKRKKYFTPLLAYGCLNTFVNMTVVQCCKSVKSACRQCTHSVKPYLKHTTAPQTSFPRKSAERVLQPF